MHLSHAARAVGAVRAVGRAHRAPRCPVPCGHASSTRAARCWHAQPTCALAPMCTVPEPARRSRPPLLLPVQVAQGRRCGGRRLSTGTLRTSDCTVSALAAEQVRVRAGNRDSHFAHCSCTRLSAPYLPSARASRSARSPRFIAGPVEWSAPMLRALGPGGAARPRGGRARALVRLVYSRVYHFACKFLQPGGFCQTRFIIEFCPPPRTNAARPSHPQGWPPV